MTFLSIGIPLVGLRFELAAVNAAEDADAAVLMTTALALIVPLSALATGVLYWLQRGGHLGFEEFPAAAVWIALVGLLAGGIVSAARYWFVRREQMGTISQVQILQNGGRAAGQIGLGAVLGGGWIGLLVGDVVGRLLGVWRMLKEAIRGIRDHWCSLRTGNLRRLLRENWRFPVFSVPSTAVNSAALHITVPLVVMFYGSSAGGHFALVQRVLAVPVVLIGSSFADTVHGRLATYARDQPQEVVPFLWRNAAILFAMAALPTVVLLLFAEELFVFVFGSEWRVAGTFAMALAPLLLARLTVSPLSRLVYVFEGQLSKFVFDGILLSITLGVFVWANASNLSVERAMWVYGGFAAGAYVVYGGVIAYIVSCWRRRVCANGQRQNS